MSEPETAAEPHADITYKPLFLYSFPQGSPCGALVGYKQGGNELTILTTRRAAHVGVGRSLAAGGFWEVGSMISREIDAMQDGDAELYREAFEELGPDIKTLIPYEAFHARTEHVWDGMVRKPGHSLCARVPVSEEGEPDYKQIEILKEGILVHSVVQKALRFNDTEFDAILKLPPTDEQRGIEPESFLLNHYNSAAEAEMAIRTRLSDFKYKEEVDAVVRLYAQKNAQFAAHCTLQ